MPSTPLAAVCGRGCEQNNRTDEANQNRYPGNCHALHDFRYTVLRLHELYWRPRESPQPRADLHLFVETREHRPAFRPDRRGNDHAVGFHATEFAWR